MPLYQFHCEKCGQLFEATASYNEAIGSSTCSVLHVEQNKMVPVLQHGRLTDGDCEGRAIYVPAFHLHAEKPRLGAITSTGQHIPGHFGKEAKRNRKKR